MAMKLRKVISGGQTGADQAGLVAAVKLGLETGGTAPKGYRTEDGSEAEVLSALGLIESPVEAYKHRTIENVRNSDATVWFGHRTTPGYYATKAACEDCMKLMFCNPTISEMQAIAMAFEVINVAGNRASKNPGVSKEVENAFAALEFMT